MKKYRIKKDVSLEEIRLCYGFEQDLIKENEINRVYSPRKLILSEEKFFKECKMIVLLKDTREIKAFACNGILSNFYEVKVKEKYIKDLIKKDYVEAYYDEGNSNE